MTHFNHEWDTTKTPAVPVSVGDRYYAQDLNDDFNYLKHLPYEVFLQGRSRGVMIAPSDTWNNDTNILTLSGGFGIVLQDCIELDPDEDFVIPPKTHSSPRYERIPFADTVLVLPNNSAVHYIVATPTKRSLLQRTKALFAEQYACRVRYDGVITIQDTAPTADQILVGLCYDKEYCLLIDNNPDQCKDNIILKKWFGQNKITQDFVSVLQSYYNITISSISTNIKIIELPASTRGIDFGNDKLLNNCNIQIDTVLSTGYAIYSGTFSNCDITVDRLNASSSYAIYNGTFTNCNITINEANNNTETKCIATTATFTNCSIFGKNIATMFRGSGRCYNCIIRLNNVRCCNNNFNFYNCDVEIEHVQHRGFVDARCYNCIIRISNIDSGGESIYTGGFSCCVIVITTVASGGSGIRNTAAVKLTLTSISATAVTDLSYTSGKLNVLNDAVLHTS